MTFNKHNLKPQELPMIDTNRRYILFQDSISVDRQTRRFPYPAKTYQAINHILKGYPCRLPKDFPRQFVCSVANLDFFNSSFMWGKETADIYIVRKSVFVHFAAARSRSLNITSASGVLHPRSDSSNIHGEMLGGTYASMMNHLGLIRHVRPTIFLWISPPSLIFCILFLLNIEFHKDPTKLWFFKSPCVKKIRLIKS